MGKTTNIAWTDHTFNPWIGCEPAIHPSGVVAQGCVNCYAAALNKRWKYNGTGTWGKGAPRTLSTESAWKQVAGWARAAAKAGVRPSVFFSLGDPLDEEAPKGAQGRLWGLIRDTWFACSGERGNCLEHAPGQNKGECAACGRAAGGLNWLLLTKRPWLWERIPADVRPLVWLGTSASDQQSWDLWVGELLNAQDFAGTFVSLEPMIGPVDCHMDGMYRRLGVMPRWVIVGGESGPKARPFRLEWARSVRDQCRAAGVRFFMKQVGSRPYPTPGFDEWPRGLPEDSAGADPSEWPEDLRVRELPW